RSRRSPGRPREGAISAAPGRFFPGGFPCGFLRRGFLRRFPGGFLCRLLAWHLAARLAGFGQADGDGLLAALDLPAGASAPELAFLHLMHGPAHLLRLLASVLFLCLLLRHRVLQLLHRLRCPVTSKPSTWLPSAARGLRRGRPAPTACAGTPAPRTSGTRQAREIVDDLQRRSAFIYWTDFLLSAGAAWLLAVLFFRAPGWGPLALLELLGAAILFFRAGTFIHEIVHF